MHIDDFPAGLDRSLYIKMRGSLTRRRVPMAPGWACSVPRIASAVRKTTALCFHAMLGSTFESTR